MADFELRTDIGGVRIEDPSSLLSSSDQRAVVWSIFGGDNPAGPIVLLDGNPLYIGQTSEPEMQTAQKPETRGPGMAIFIPDQGDAIPLLEGDQTSGYSGLLALATGAVLNAARMSRAAEAGEAIPDRSHQSSDFVERKRAASSAMIAYSISSQGVRYTAAMVNLHREYSKDKERLEAEIAKYKRENPERRIEDITGTVLGFLGYNAKEGEDAEDKLDLDGYPAAFIVDLDRRLRDLRT